MQPFLFILPPFSALSDSSFVQQLDLKAPAPFAFVRIKNGKLYIICFAEACNGKMNGDPLHERLNFNVEIKDRFLVCAKTRQTDIWRLRLEHPDCRQLFVE
jgi:hypothetical protein